MSEVDEIVKEFLIESNSVLEKLDQEFVALEADPKNRETLNGIFRSIHTIKGTCGFLEFAKLESITHVGETLLDSLRAGKLLVTPQITTELLRLLDSIRELLAMVERTGAEGEKDYSDLINSLTALNEVPAPVDNCSASKTDMQSNSKAIELIHVIEEPLAIRELTLNKVGLDSSIGKDNIMDKKMESSPPPSSESSVKAEVTKNNEELARSSLADSSIRVDVGLLDELMNLVGELVLTRNQILRITKSSDDPVFQSTSQRLNLITSELQEGVMKTRMQPIENVWNKFPRVVRDLSRQLGKNIRLEMEGKDTELDKTIIEAIKDPLTHIVRNSVDHGIEDPKIRGSKGKNPEGCITLRAFHEGGHVVVEIADDGAGLNTDRIKQKALERNLVSPDRLSKMSEQEVNSLIFLPGFSTAEAITNISGRGVGMDVVRSNIEKIGGQIDLNSRLHHGSSIRIKIPLTLAIVPALMVTVKGERFAIPQASLLELLRVDESGGKPVIETVGGSKFYRLRGNLLPLIMLAPELKIGEESKASDGFNIVVVKSDEKVFGVVVDEVHDTEEIVVKPLSRQLKDIGVFAGATILGDGRVALILDILGLAKRGNITAPRMDSAPELSNNEATSSSGTASNSTELLLLLQTSEHQRMAMPLSSVHRLEEFTPSQIEKAGNQALVQYREGILPLIDLGQFFENKAETVAELQQVVVFFNGTKSYGFIVNRILDIVEEKLNLQTNHKRRGTCGAAVIQHKITEILDPEKIVEFSCPS